MGGETTVTAVAELADTTQHGLPDNVPFVMPNTGGVTVTPIEANHCKLKKSLVAAAQLLIKFRRPRIVHFPL